MRYFKVKNEYNSKVAHTVFEWIDSLVCAAVLCILIFSFTVKTMRVQGTSMYPTYQHGQRVIAVTPIMGLNRGDVVVTDAHNGTGDPLIKRVIAMSGDIVFIDADGVVMVNGKEIQDYVDTLKYNTYGDQDYPLIVPDGMVFLMGDNREVSYDSRYQTVGCISEKSIIGKVIS